MLLRISRLKYVAALLVLTASFVAAVPADTAPAGMVNHTFRFVPPAGSATVPVSVAADFNGWKAEPNPMKRGADGVYSVTVAVAPGLHHYKIVYDGKWIADPAGDKSLEEDDGFQGMNSGFNAAAEIPAGSPTHTFRYTPPQGDAPVTVSVVGDFNGWKAEANPLKRGDDGVYTATVAVPAGMHYYKIVCDGKWIPDPAGEKALEFDDGFQGVNSGFYAAPVVKPPKAGMAQHTFHYRPPANSPNVPVSIAADFNGWKADVNKMTRIADGSYTVTVDVPPGRHHYKVVYDGKWIADPDGDKTLEEDDGFQGMNSGFDAKIELPKPVPVNPNGGKPIAPPHVSAVHSFRYDPPAGAADVPVSVAGDFNGWKAATPLPRGEDGAYAATVEVPYGLHHYKIVYDGKWIVDPAADKSFDYDDGFGGLNSGFFAELNAQQFPPSTADAINIPAIVFDPANLSDLDVISPTEMRVTLRARADDVTAASVISGEVRTPMSIVATAGGINSFTAITSPKPFVFELSKPLAMIYVADGYAFDKLPAERYTPATEPPVVTPDWAKHAVWYQILPERFRNGDASNDPPNTVAWTSKWFDTQPGEKGDFYSFIWGRRYGGDLQGIREKLPYLRKLGINAIYLNPIFQSPSLHKYNTSDYRHVDEHVGVAGDIEQLQGETEDPATWQWTASDKIFLDLIAEAHRQGFKVIIDGVYNHTGTQFWAFQDVIKNRQASKYASWYDITDWTPSADRDGQAIPFHYTAWDGPNGEAPEFKRDDTTGIARGPREHIFAIARRWLAPDGDPSRGVDGFRLDAPEKIPHIFWVDFRSLVKSIKPDAFISGEIWPWAQDWLDGTQYDAVTNYQFAEPAQQFFANQQRALSPTGMAAACNRLAMNYPFQSALANMNLLDSHDTDRAASMIVNPDLSFNMGCRIQENHPTYQTRKPEATETLRMLQEVAFQMTFVGAPMIYYGDEAGMWGAGDPSGRQPMTWDDLGNYADPEVVFDTVKFAHYQRLIAIRRTLPALQTGTYRTLSADDAAGTFAFARDLGDQHVSVVLNRSDKPVTLTVPGVKGAEVFNWLDPSSVEVSTKSDRPEAVLTAAAQSSRVVNGSVEIELPSFGSAVLAPAR